MRYLLITLHRFHFFSVLGVSLEFSSKQLFLFMPSKIITNDYLGDHSKCELTCLFDIS